MPYARRARRTSYRSRKSTGFKRRFRRGLRRGTYRRRSTSRAIATSRITGSRAVSNRTFVKLIAYGVGTLKAAAGTLAGVLHFGGNDLLTPDTDSGCNVITMGQGLGRDQWFAFYTNCYVAGSKITMRIKNITGVASATSTNYQPITVCIFPYNRTDNANYTAGSVSTLPPSTQPFAKSRVLNQPDGGGALTHISSYCATKRILGRKQDLDEYQNLNNATTAPTAPWQWIFTFLPLSGTVALAEVSFEVKITYYCCFLNRTILAKS